MGMSIPPGLNWLVELAAGQNWPKGDEDALAAVGDAWNTASQQVRAVVDDIADSVSAVREGFSGPAAEQFSVYMAGLHQTLPPFADGAAQMGSMSSQVAVQIEYAKYMIILEIIWMAEQIAQWASTLWGAAAVPVIEGAGQLAVRSILVTLAKQVARSVVESMAAQAGMDAAVQSLQMFVLHDRSRWDTSNTVGALELGALAGTLGWALGFGAGKIAPTLVKSLAGHAVMGAVNGVVIGELSDAAAGGKSDAGLGAASGALGGGAAHRRETKVDPVDVPQMHLDLDELEKLPNFDHPAAGLRDLPPGGVGSKESDDFPLRSAAAAGESTLDWADPSTGGDRFPVAAPAAAPTRWPDGAAANDPGPWTASQAPLPKQAAPTPVAQAVRDWGEAREGVLGLVHLDQVPEETVAGLRAEIADEVRVVSRPSALPWQHQDSIDEQVAASITPVWIEERLPYLRSEQGQPFTVLHEGHTYTAWLRLALTDPVPSRSVPDHDPGVAEDRPVLKLEKRSVASSESRDTGQTANYRSLPIPVPIPVPATRGALDGVTLTPQVTLTHNQTTTTSVVGSRLMHSAVLRSRENSRPYDFQQSWQVKVHAGGPGEHDESGPPSRGDAYLPSTTRYTAAEPAFDLRDEPAGFGGQREPQTPATLSRAESFASYTSSAPLLPHRSTSAGTTRSDSLPMDSFAADSFATDSLRDSPPGPLSPVDAPVDAALPGLVPRSAAPAGRTPAAGFGSSRVSSPAARRTSSLPLLHQIMEEHPLVALRSQSGASSVDPARTDVPEPPADSRGLAQREPGDWGRDMFARTGSPEPMLPGSPPRLPPGANHGLPAGLPAPHARDVGWRSLNTQGVVRALVPDHMATDEKPAVDPNDPATLPVDSLDDIPLYSTEAIKDPGRLLRDVRRLMPGELASLSKDSHKAVEEFLSEKSQRSQMPLMRKGAYVSPVLVDSAGRPVGVLKVEAQVDRFTPLKSSTRVMMENYLFRGVRTEGSVAVSNGMDLSVQASIGLSADPEHGHPNSSNHLGGQITPHYDYSHNNTRSLGASSTASIAHALKSQTPHLLSSADLRYTVTLVRPGEADLTHDLGLWREGAQMRVQTKATAAGLAQPPPRFAPPEVRDLTYVGMSATAHKVEGTDGLFARAESWLRVNGYLPDPARAPGEAGAAQLENYRRLAAVRSDVGLRAGVDEMVDGGHSVYFDKPVGGGVERVELRLTARPGATGPEHRRTVPNVQVINFTNSTMTATEGFGESAGHTLGVAAGIDGPLQHVPAHVRGSLSPADYAATSTTSTTRSVNNGTVYEQAVLSAGAQKLDVFHVPLRLQLDLHTDDAERPAIRFADVVGAADPADGGPGVAGSMELWLPEQRTSGADPGPAPAPPAPPAVRVATEQDLQALREQSVKMPHSSVVDAMAGSKELIRAFRDIVAGRFDAAGPGEEAAAARPAPAPATSLGRAGKWLWSKAFGTDPAHPGSLVQQLGRGALAPVKLIANGHQVLDGVYSVEHLAVPGLVSDRNMTIEVEAFLSNPRLLTNPDFEGSHHGGFPAYTETDVYAPDGTSLAKASAVTHQYQGTASVTPKLPGSLSGLTPQARYTRTSQSRHTETDATATQVNRVTSEDDVMYRFGTDVHYVLTVKRGSRNFIANALGLGRQRAVRVLVGKPAGGQFVLNAHQVRDHAAVLGPDARRLVDTPGALPPLGAPRHLPERFRAGDGIGLGSITDVAASGPRAAFLGKITTLVEGITPGVLTPGHAAYTPGLKSRIADYASPVGMRGLAGRGERGSQVLHYVHQHAFGAELVELRLNATPVHDRLDTVVGHEVSVNTGAENGTEVYQAHGAVNITNSDSVITGNKVTIGLNSTHPGDLHHTMSDESSLAAAATRTRTATESHGLTIEDRTSLRTGKAAVFDVPYRYRVELRKTPLDGSVLNKLNQVGPGLVRLTDGAYRWLRGSVPVRADSLDATVKIRFATTETTPAVPDPDRAGHYTPAPPATDRLTPQVLRQDPFTADGPPPHAVLAMDGGETDVRLLPSPDVFELRHDFSVHSFTGIDQVHAALHAVTPKLFPRGARLFNSEENAAKQMTEMLRAGTTVLRNDRGEFGLTSATGDEHDAVTVTATLSGMRRLDTGAVMVDRMRNATTSASSAGSRATTTALVLDEVFHAGAPAGGGLDLAVVDHTRSVHGQTASLTANRRDIVKNEPGPRGASHEVRSDLVLRFDGPRGTRWVTGTLYGRALDADVLGRGLTEARPYDSVFDLRSVYREIDAGPPPTPGRYTEAAAEQITASQRAADQAAGRADSAAPGPTAHLWLDLHGLPEDAAATAVDVAGRTARALGRPVELSLRQAPGGEVRHVLLDARGELQADHEAARRAWQAFSAAADSLRALRTRAHESGQTLAEHQERLREAADQKEQDRVRHDEAARTLRELDREASAAAELAGRTGAQATALELRVRAARENVERVEAAHGWAATTVQHAAAGRADGDGEREAAHPAGREAQAEPGRFEASDQGAREQLESLTREHGLLATRFAEQDAAARGRAAEVDEQAERVRIAGGRLDESTAEHAGLAKATQRFEQEVADAERRLRATAAPSPGDLYAAHDQATLGPRGSTTTTALSPLPARSAAPRNTHPFNHSQGTPAPGRAPSAGSTARAARAKPRGGPLPGPEHFGLGRRVAPVAHVETERFDPAVDQSRRRAGYLAGAMTRIRYDVRRFQTPGGGFVREFVIDAPIARDRDVRAEDLSELEASIQFALDDAVNTRMRLPRSGDQFHVTVRLREAPRPPAERGWADAPAKVRLARTHTADPAAPRAQTDQFTWHLDDPVELLVHEAFHFLGVGDQAQDDAMLLRRFAGRDRAPAAPHDGRRPPSRGATGSTRAGGLMGMGTPLVIDPDYLALIEEVCDASATLAVI